MTECSREEFLRQEMAHKVAQEDLANEVELWSHLVNTVGPNVEAAYIAKIGQLEFRLEELEISIRRWRRRFELRQSYLNQGEKPDAERIERTLEDEFQDYLAALKEREAEVDRGRGLYHCGHMDDSSCTELRCVYLDAVKKLHPDVNPDLPERAVWLWNRIQQAYKAKDWGQMKFLCGMVDDVAGEGRTYPNDAEGLAALVADTARMREKGAELARKIAELRKEAPLVYQELIEDPDEVELRQGELKRQIAEAEETVADYERRWDDGE